MARIAERGVRPALVPSLGSHFPTVIPVKTYLPLLLCCVLAAPAAAQEKTPIPPFSGERLIVAGVPNTYGPLRADIDELERSSHQRYYVVIVNSSGADNNTKYYADALARDWLDQATKKKLPFDADRAVIVVLAVQNKQLSVHAGKKLQSDGLSPELIDKDIVRPTFLPHAKAGNYLNGLQELLPAIEQRIGVLEKVQPTHVNPVQDSRSEGTFPPPPAPPQAAKTTAAAPVTPPPASGRSLLLSFLLGVLVVVALGFGIARLLHVSTKRGVEERFKTFRDRVMDLRQRVEGVQERHKLLPTVDKNFQTPMAGATLAMFNQVDADVRRLMDDWLKRMDVWERVQSLIAAETYFSSSRLRQANGLLDQLGSFDEVDTACQGCVTSLDRLEQSHTRGQTLLQEADTRTGRLREQMGSVAALGLATVAYDSELSGCATALEEGRKLLPADPIGGVHAAEAVQKRMDALHQRMDEVVRLFKRAPEAQAALDRVSRLAAERRAGGLRLSEPEGCPDPLLEQGRAQHRDMLQALQHGEPQEAEKHLDRALAVAADAEKRIERQVAARAVCQREIPARRADAQQLRQEEAQAHSQRLELEHGFAPESWREVAEHSARAGELQAKATALLDEAAQAAADGVQHYFRATALLEQVKKEQEQAHELLRAIGQSLQRLTELRRECQGRRQEMGELARRAQGYLAAHKGVVRSPARACLDTAEGRWQQARAQADGPRPNWPAVQKLLEESRQEYAAAQKEAEEDVRCHRQLEDRLTEAERLGERVGVFLGRHHEDRQQANETYRTAVAALQRARQEMSERQSDWAQLLRRVEEAAGGLAKAEELARQDLQLADRASVEIEEAGRQIERAGNFFSDGISADVGSAEQLLEHARHLLGSQAYEQAIDRAKAAQQAARQAHDNAANRVRQEQERQRLAATAAAAAAAQAFAATKPSADDFGAKPAPPESALTQWSAAAEVQVKPPPEQPAATQPPPKEPPSESSQTSW
jgi:uncharacterized membrane protein YgcG